MEGDAIKSSMRALSINGTGIKSDPHLPELEEEIAMEESVVNGSVMGSFLSRFSPQPRQWQGCRNLTCLDDHPGPSSDFRPLGPAQPVLAVSCDYGEVLGFSIFHTYVAQMIRSSYQGGNLAESLRVLHPGSILPFSSSRLRTWRQEDWPLKNRPGLLKRQSAPSLPIMQPWKPLSKVLSCTFRPYV